MGAPLAPPKQEGTGLGDRPPPQGQASWACLLLTWCRKCSYKAMDVLGTNLVTEGIQQPHWDALPK